jgi:hypothetical protein
MTDHNARQAGLTEEQLDVAITAFNEFPCPMGGSVCRFPNREQMRAALLAAHSADARNGEGVAVELIELLRAIRPEFGAVGSRDVDVRAQQNRIDRAIELLAAPAAPAPTVPEGYALVPLRMNQAMEDLAQEGEWEWADMLAAAEAITEAQYNEIYGVDAAPAPAAQADERVALGKWSEECKKWGHPATPEARAAFIDGYRARQQSATPPECTCPSGNGSLRHPCPVHAAQEGGQ